MGVSCILMCVGSELCCGWLQCSCCTEHGRQVCLAYMQKLWSASAVLDLYGMLEFKLCCENLLLLNMADTSCLLCGKLWSEQ